MGRQQRVLDSDYPVLLGLRLAVQIAGCGIGNSIIMKARGAGQVIFLVPIVSQHY